MEEKGKSKELYKSGIGIHCMALRKAIVFCCERVFSFEWVESGDFFILKFICVAKNDRYYDNLVFGRCVETWNLFGETIDFIVLKFDFPRLWIVDLHKYKNFDICGDKNEEFLKTHEMSIYWIEL